MHQQNQTILARMSAIARQRPDDPFLCLLDSFGAGPTLSYRELFNAAGPWTYHYQQRGLQPGERVIIILPHSLDLYAAYLGAALGGFVPVMFSFPSPKFSRETYARTIGALVANAEARLVVTYPELAAHLPEMASTLTATLITTAQDLPPAQPDAVALDPLPLETTPDAPAILQYSSGTTGLKKGICLSHRALLWQVDHYSQAIGASAEDKIVTWLPLYHDMGLIACLWLPLLRGVPIVAMSPFDWVRRPRMLLEAITAHRATLCWMPNFAFNHIARAVGGSDLKDIDLTSLRGLVNCSEPVLHDSHEALLKVLGPRGLRRQALWTCYALAENTFAVTSGASGGGASGGGGGDDPMLHDAVDADELARHGWAVPAAPGSQARVLLSSGRPLPQTQVHILDAQRRPLPERTVGEIAIQSPCLMAGYFNNPQATADRFHDGWYLTGDLGYLAGGALMVLGRKDDLIILAGKNLDPSDVEALVNQHPAVIPGRAVALGVDDPQSGTQKLVIVAETHETDAVRLAATRQKIFSRVAAGSDVTADDVRLVAHGFLAKSSSGKLSRRENRQRYLEVCAHDAAAPASSPGKDTTIAVIERIVQVIARSLPSGRHPPATELRQSKNLVSSGLIDSAGLVSLILGLEAEFTCTIPPADQTTLSHFESAPAMEKLIARLRGAAPAGLRSPLPDAQVIMSDRDRKCLDFLAGPRSFDLIMIGSSRMQALSARLAATLGYQAFNFGVSSARSEDWHCILQFVLQHNRRPLRQVLLGIDIEAFANNYGVDHRLSHSLHLQQYLDPGDQVPEAAAVPPDRRQAVFLTLRTQTADSLRTFRFEPDTGDLIYTAGDAVSHAFNRRQSVALADVRSFDAEYKLRMAGFTAQNPKRVSYFIRTVQASLDRNIGVTAFLTTLHPALEQFLSRETMYSQRVAEFTAGLRHNRAANFRFLDCSKPESFGGSPDDFVNPAHLGGYNAGLLLQHLLVRAPGPVVAPAAAAS